MAREDPSRQIWETLTKKSNYLLNPEHSVRERFPPKWKQNINIP